MKRMSVNGLRRQAGVTILEFIAFIGLAALVIAGALGLYSTANSGAQSNDLFQAASGLATTTRQVASGQSTFPPAGASISAPTGWTTDAVANPTFTKNGATGNTIKLTLGPTSFNVVLTAADQKFAEQLTGKLIGSVSGTRSTNVVTWSAIAY